MKIDRLLAITIHLLNHEKVTSDQLATKFEVSVRTIKRDIESLSEAGIPVVSTIGANGGYMILDTFGLNRPLTTSSDFALIVAALKSLNTAVDDVKLEQTLEKIQAVRQDKHSSSKVFIDFSIVKENQKLQQTLKILEQAIKSENVVKFIYHGHANLMRKVEPLALNYRWYAWYLLSFEPDKNDYRIFKLSRISELEISPQHFMRQIENLANLLEQQWSTDQRRIIRIKLYCQAQIRQDIDEVFRAEVTETQENGDFICTFEVPEKEQLWFAQLLGFGAKVQVLEPKALRSRIQKTAQEISELYNKE